MASRGALTRHSRDDSGGLFAAVGSVKRLTMHIGIVLRRHGMQAARPLCIDDGILIFPEPDLRLRKRHHAVRIVGVEFDRALCGLQPA